VSARKVPRWPILLALAAIVVAAIVFDQRESAHPASATVEGASVVGAAVPSPRALSTSWYCAEGTSTPDGRADETVDVASVSDARITATVTVLPGGTSAPVSRTLQLEPREEQHVHVADLVASPEPAVVVEVVGGQAVVAHEITAEGDVATEPCARGASSDWYFANGTTLKGATQYLVLFDPFGDDAVVDVSFVTDDGVQQPDALQGLSVPRRSRVSIAIQDSVPRQREVAIHVHARTGRVVAERSQMFDGTASEGEVARHGVALSLGADAPSRSWYFPEGTTADGATSTLAVANFGDTSTSVSVGVSLEGSQTFAAQSVDVPARSVTSVNLATGVPAGSQYAVTVTSGDAEGRGAPVVAELLSWWPDASSSTGVASTMGSTRLARRWVVPQPSARVDGIVTVLNPGGSAASAAMLVYTAGDTTGPPSEPERAIDAGHVGVFDVAGIGITGQHVLVVTSAAPIAVGVHFTGVDGAAANAAIPDYNPGAS